VKKAHAMALLTGLAFAAVAILSTTRSEAAELQVLAGGGIAGPLKDIAAGFQSASGHSLVIRYGTTPELIRMMTTGGPFDLVVVPREVFRDAATPALVAGPTEDVARVGLGVAVRAGAPKPDISTPDALKQALLAAKSIAAIPESAAGAQMLRAFDRLGIGEAMKARIRVQANPAQIVETVSKGEAELGVFLVNVLTAPGLDVVGPFPAELRQDIVFTAAVATKAVQADAARAFIAYLKSPAAVAVIRAKGMQSG
jgi:molybdate transport system substrate-binding protein